VPSASRLDAVATPGSFRRFIFPFPFLELVNRRKGRYLQQNDNRTIASHFHALGASLPRRSNSSGDVGLCD
jgi:hypothetical protein